MPDFMVSSHELHSRTQPVVFLAAIGIALIMVYPFITPIVLAAITTYIFDPIIKKLERYKHLYQITLVLIIIFTGLALFASIFYISRNAGQIMEDISGFGEKINVFISAFSSTISNAGFAKYFNLSPDAGELTGKLTSYVINITSDIVTSIPIMLLNIVIYLYASYYFMHNSDKILKSIKAYISTMPDEDGQFASSIMRGLKKGFDVLILSYITMSIIVSAISFIGYSVFGVPHAFLLSILTGIFSFLPIFGVWMIYVPAAVYMYYTGNVFAAGGILAFGVIILTFLIPMILQPYLGSQQSNVHPLTIFIGFFAGPVIFGAKGMLLGPIILVIVETIIFEYIELRTSELDEIVPPG